MSDIVVIPKRRCGSLSLNYCTSQRSAAAHRLRRQSQGNRAGARDCTGQGYGSEVTSYDALPLLPKCERGDVGDLETVSEMTHPGFVEEVFSAAGVGAVNRHSLHQTERVRWGR